MILRRGNYTPEKAKHLRGMARVAGFLTCTTLVCGVISIRHARAEYQDQTLVFGKQMLDLAKASNHEVTKIVFNGQAMHVGSSVTLDTPEEVLHRYEEYCKANRGQTGDDFTELEKELEKASPTQKRETSAKLAEVASSVAAKVDTAADAPAIAKAGFVRSEGKDGDGAVVCFVKGAKTKPTTSEAFESFMATGELGAFGELRYAYASKARNGKTLVLTAWTDSQFNLRDMVPEDGQDAPGEDFAEIPRVPSSIRVMSAKAADMPYGVNVYRTTNSPSKTLEYFDTEMKKAGWFTYDPEMTEEEHKGLGRAYMKNAVVVTLGTSVQSDGSYIAVGLSGVAADEKLGRR